MTPIRFIPLALLFASSLSAASAQTSFVVQAPVFAGSLPAPRIVLAGDIDSDGRGDLLSLYPPDNGILDALRISPLGKPLAPSRVKAGFGKDALAAACSDFREPGKASVLALLGNGQVRLLHTAGAGTTLAQEDLVCTLTPRQMPKAPVRALAADLSGDGRPDLLLAGADGRLTLIRTGAGVQTVKFVATSVRGSIRSARQVCAGRFGSSERAQVVWLDDRGKVRMAKVLQGENEARLDRIRSVANADPEDQISAGRFLGGKADDLLVGNRLFSDGDVKRTVVVSGLPERAASAGDYAWIAADCDGDGKADLIRVRRTQDRFTGSNVLISFSKPGLADSSGDGLLDAWKTGAIKPGGLDLAALGCKVGRREVIVEIQRMEDVPEATVRSEMERVRRYFASLPVENPDGSLGIRLHVIHREPIPQADRGRAWWDLGARYHPESHRGVTHWMVIYNGGGGQSSEMSDRGSCGVHALYASFIHEFGHQLGLPHTGFWNGWSPTYPSLMNYTYSYQLGGRGDAIGYSDGRLSGVVLNQARLDERLPLPPEKISFLAGPPYHFRLKPDQDGSGTLVDWNWNGLFGEKAVAAPINYGYGTSAGLRHTIGKTYTAPALATAGKGRNETLLCFAGRLPEGAPLPAADGSAQKPGLAPDNPGCLRMRVWMGSSPKAEGGKWSDEFDVETGGVTGDPSAASLDGAAWVAYASEQGAVLRRATLDRKRAPVLGTAQRVPESAGAQVTLARVGERLALFLWRDAKSPVSLRLLSVQKDEVLFGPERKLGFTSLAPVGAATGPKSRGEGSLWVAVTQDQDTARPSRWQVRRLEIRGDEVSEREWEWVGGEKGQERGSGRAVLLWEPDKSVGPEGRLYFLCTGTYSPQSPWQCHYVSMRIGDRKVNGGWLTRRYYDEWTQSRSAPGAAWFRGDFAFASRWFGNVRGTENDNLFVAFFGRGIDSEPMGDFDDIGFIRDVGLRHSIPWVTR